MTIFKGYSVGFIFLLILNYISEFFNEYSPTPKEFYLNYSWVGLVLIFPLFIYVLMQIQVMLKEMKHNRTKANTFIVAMIIGFISGAFVLHNMGII